MSPTERPLQSATYDHVALSVGDLDQMVSFYERMGFDDVSHVDFDPAPIRLVTMTNAAGASIELTSNSESDSVQVANDPTAASRRRGLFHFAFHVTSLTTVLDTALAAGARLVIPPAHASGHATTYAYIADPEGNLLELIEATF